MRRTVRIATNSWLLSAVIAVYWVLCWVPASFWFDSQGQIVTDADFGGTPTVSEERTIRRSFDGAYTADVRDAVSQLPVPGCSGFDDRHYLGGLSGVRSMSLVEWVDDRPGCATLRPGSYFLYTCRTVLRPLWGLVPAKTQCWQSNLFIIREGKK